MEFMGNLLDTLRKFSMSARQMAGYQLDIVQHGGEPDDWKPMPSIGAGVNEIRVHDDFGQYRVIYIAKLEDAIYVLHCFQKKTQKTARSDLDLARTRLKEVLRRYK